MGPGTRAALSGEYRLLKAAVIRKALETKNRDLVLCLSPHINYLESSLNRFMPQGKKIGRLTFFAAQILRHAHHSCNLKVSSRRLRNLREILLPRLPSGFFHVIIISP
jgi:hypothetical protein